MKGGEHKTSGLVKSYLIVIAGKSKGKSSKEGDLSKTNTLQWKLIHPRINRQQTLDLIGLLFERGRDISERSCGVVNAIKTSLRNKKTITRSPKLR